MQFTVPAVLDAVAATIGDRVVLTQRDRRYTYAQVVSGPTVSPRTYIRAGLAATPRATPWPVTRSGRTSSASTSTTATSTSRACSAPTRRASRRSTSTTATSRRSCVYLLADSGATRDHVPRDLRAARRRGSCRSCPTSGAASRSPTTPATPCCPARSTTRTALAAASTEPPPVEPSPDDLYILYTGGTTGMPKGVLWRQADIFVAAHRRPRPRQRASRRVDRRDRRTRRGTDGAGSC